MQTFPDLRQILHEIDWLAVGAVAARAYMPERTTQDLDILIRAVDAERVDARLLDAGFQKAADLGIPGIAYTAPDGMEIDVLYGTQPWLEEALAAPERDPARFPVLALPYLVLMKLHAGRVQDIADVATMLGWADDTAIAAVRAAVDRFSAADREDLESLIYLGRRERGVSDSN